MALGDPVIYVALDNAKRVDPEVFFPYLTCDLNGIPEICW
jgi:hypothetical protein